MGAALSVRSWLDNWELMTPEQRVDFHTSPHYEMNRIAKAMRNDGNTPEEVGEFVQFMEKDHERVLRWPGAKLKEAVCLVAEEQEKLKVQDVTAPVDTSLQRWKSGIARLDHALDGGCYGLTVFAGQPKQGKSLAALGAGLEASQSGWYVAYVNAEMTEGQTYLRASNWAMNKSEFNEENFLLINTFGGCEIKDIQQAISENIQPQTPRLLVVLDSLNRLHENDGSRSYWDSMERWSSWARVATRKSGGLVSFLVVSELGVSGHVKGRKLDYAADCLVRFTEPEMPGCVDIEIQYSRSTPSGEVGLHERNFETSTFVPAGIGTY